MSAPGSATPEFSRMIDLRSIPARAVVLEPDEAERRRLAGRFAISAIRAMRAEVELEPQGAVVTATGRLTASIVQPCAISGEDFPVEIDEPFYVRFVPARHDHKPDEEIELEAEDLDEVEYDGTAFDLGEAAAQTLGLAIDPFATGPDADAARKEHKLDGNAASGPFAALAALKKDD